MLVKPLPELSKSTEPIYTWISQDRLYVVVTLVCDDYRVVDDKGEPVLIPSTLFALIDPSVPSSWTVVDERPDWYWCGPPEVSVPGFFERWHDGARVERGEFARIYAALWASHASQLRGQVMTIAGLSS